MSEFGSGRVVVTGGDAGYFPLIEDLAASIRAHRTADELGFAVIDAGLEPQQREQLATRYGARLLDVSWEFQVGGSRVRGREHLKVQLARSFLDQYLPDAELIAWIDADAWVQEASALDLIFQAAQTGRLAVMAETSRQADHGISLKWSRLGHAKVDTFLYKNARRAAVRIAEARRIADRPLLNTGVFAMRREAPHWALWRARHAEVVRRGRVFTSDQLSLALAVYIDGAETELLPELCNTMGPHWRCSEDGTKLVERYVPNAPVGVVHLAGYDAMRRDPALTIPILTVDGRTLHRSLRRGAWAAEGG